MPVGSRIIGVDESGKGDFFGPLVIASICIDNKDSAKLFAEGVRDGKKIADGKLLKLDDYLRGIYPHSVVVISPQEYNLRYAEIKNLNKLLAAGHAEVIEKTLEETPADYAISDKFGKTELIENELASRKCTLPLQQLVKGEQIFQVAAASILARASFLREIEMLSDKISFPLPKGAGPPVDQAGRALLDKHGLKIFPSIAKMHFKNLQKIKALQLF